MSAMAMKLSNLRKNRSISLLVIKHHHLVISNFTYGSWDIGFDVDAASSRDCSNSHRAIKLLKNNE
ncbi:hypothetical protein Sjap_010975 [Stephania japonica]|uniref:Uncharacterized protein n=1 Tax=Stephania japonica TaxID=461633 RepID=A0AAP0JCM4_9MAGN